MLEKIIECCTFILAPAYLAFLAWVAYEVTR